MLSNQSVQFSLPLKKEHIVLIRYHNSLCDGFSIVIYYISITQNIT